jgi:hypothetical protein
LPRTWSRIGEFGQDERLGFSFMNFTFRELRDRLHPLNRVRRYSACRQILNVFDVPVWTRMPGVKWKVRARLVRHASSFLLAGGVEPGISCLFRTIAQETGVRSLWDVGANIGYYSWVVKSLVPDCTVRLHEPEPDNLRLIEETIRRGGQRSARGGELYP